MAYLLGFGAVFVTLLTIASPSEAGPGEVAGGFEPRSDDPQAADYEPPERRGIDGVSFSFRVSNQIVRVFGLERAHAYGLDVQVGPELLFEEKGTIVVVRPETGYAYVHHADFDRHASITGLGLCLLPYEPLTFAYTPRFVAGAEAGQLALGFRHGFAFGFTSMLSPYYSNLAELEVQHGVLWVGGAGPRHELRGVLTVNVVELWLTIYDAILTAKM